MEIDDSHSPGRFMSGLFALPVAGALLRVALVTDDCPAVDRVFLIGSDLRTLCLVRV